MLKNSAGLYTSGKGMGNAKEPEAKLAQVPISIVPCSRHSTTFETEDVTGHRLAYHCQFDCCIPVTWALFCDSIGISPSHRFGTADWMGC